MECYTKEVEQKIVERFGDLGEIQIRERVEEGESFFRIFGKSMWKKDWADVLTWQSRGMERFGQWYDMRECPIFTFFLS